MLGVMLDLGRIVRGWPLALVLAGCGGGDNKGSDSGDSSGGTSSGATSDDSTSDATTAGSTSDATTGDPPTTGGTNPMPCDEFEEDVPFSGSAQFPMPQDVLDDVNVYAGATLAYTDGGSTPLALEFVYTDGRIHASGTDCPELGIQGTLDMEVTMNFATDDGMFAEALPATLSVDLQFGTLSVYAPIVAPADLEGTFQVPMMIGSHMASEFAALELVFNVQLQDAPPGGEVSVGGELEKCQEPECFYYSPAATW
jgi:hypothetical protein